jgi:hypothetical protein
MKLYIDFNPFSVLVLCVRNTQTIEVAMATIQDHILRTLTGAGFPWVARIYFVLIVLFGSVMVWTTTHAGGNAVLPDTDLRVRLFNVSSDALKTVLGALMGSLSLAAEALWKTSKAKDEPESKPAEVVAE